MKRYLVILCIFALSGAVLPSETASASSAGPSLMHQAIEQVQPKIVKIYGAGGIQQMEAYQTGMLISPEGDILTVWSYVLDTDDLVVVLSDGRRFAAKLLGADPRLEMAVLKIEAAGLPCFDLNQAVPAEVGQRVLAFSNLFGVATGNEPVSVQKGVVSVKTQLHARRGVFETPYDGPVYVLDVVTNNPGAAGGALVTQRGQLVAVLGKELRNSLNDTWLNYAVPIEELRSSVDRIRTGTAAEPVTKADKKPDRPLTPGQLGITLVPDVVDRTPPYVDDVRPDSPAAKAGIRIDDMIIMVNQQLIRSCQSLVDELARIERETPVRLSIVRGQELLEVELKAPE
jgi:serine protease Do